MLKRFTSESKVWIPPARPSQQTPVQKHEAKHRQTTTEYQPARMSQCLALKLFFRPPFAAHRQTTTEYKPARMSQRLALKLFFARPPFAAIAVAKNTKPNTGKPLQNTKGLGNQVQGLGNQVQGLKKQVQGLKKQGPGVKKTRSGVKKTG